MFAKQVCLFRQDLKIAPANIWPRKREHQPQQAGGQSTEGNTSSGIADDKLKIEAAGCSRLTLHQKSKQLATPLNNDCTIYGATSNDYCICMYYKDYCCSIDSKYRMKYHDTRSSYSTHSS